MDGDIFGTVTKLGRGAADAVFRALAGNKWDPFLASRTLDVLLNAAGGIPSLPVVAVELAALRGSPLLARLETEGSPRQIREASLGPGCTELDLILRPVVERAILAGEYGFPKVLERFCAALLERAILCGRGGFLEEHGTALLQKARDVLAPVAAAAAAILYARPDAKRLGLARPRADLKPDTDLRGGPDAC